MISNNNAVFLSGKGRTASRQGHGAESTLTPLRARESPRGPQRHIMYYDATQYYATLQDDGIQHKVTWDIMISYDITYGSVG